MVLKKLLPSKYMLGAFSSLVILVVSLASACAEDEFFDESKVITLFAFDDVSIPWTRNLKLKMNSPTRHPGNPVVQRGKPGSPDSWAVQFYGSIIREQEKFRMWYVAVGEERFDSQIPRSAPWRVAYAESRDGVHWTKPNLGLVEYLGNRDNNLVLIEPRIGILNLKVLREPLSSDSRQKYKMGAHVWFPKNGVRLGTFAPYGSEDGFRWKLLIDAKPVNAELSPEDLVLPAIHFEPVGGLYKWDGLYYLSGQNAIPAARPYHGRVVRSFVSPDFVNWSQASAVGFVRTPQHNLLGPGRSREGEQNHEAISVWNRGNVLLGISGLWHGGKEWKDVTVDLGFVVSNDGLHFRQPLHEWVFLKRGMDGEWDQGGLLQGQGFANVGDQTFIYYGAWDPRVTDKSTPRGGVGIAQLPRDRFGELVVDESRKGPGTYQVQELVAELMTGKVKRPKGGATRFSVNAAGLGANAQLRVELLDENLVPLPDYAGENAALVKSSGFQVPIQWNENPLAESLPEEFRIRVRYEGERKADIRLSAIYVH